MFNPNPKAWSCAGIECSNYGKTIFVPASIYAKLKDGLNESLYAKTITPDGVRFKLLKMKKGEETKVKPVVGMRVRVFQGERNWNGPGKHHINAVWIAGEVPVGTEGTIYVEKIDGNEKRPMFAVKFDGIEPKPGYFFGMSDDNISGSLQVI